MTDRSFTDRAVVVTGAAQGMGRAIAEIFAPAGAKLVLFDLDEETLASTSEAIAATGTPVEHVVGDVSKRADVRRAVDVCVSTYGQLDVMIAQAGIASPSRFLDIDDEAWNRMIAVNLTGAFLSVQEAARAMVETGGGSIVVTASTNAFFAESDMAHYTASKGGVVAFVKAAAIDLAPLNIRVNAVNPGMVNTQLASFLVHHPTAGPEYLKQVPLRRFGEPEDVAKAAFYLASDDSSYITGEALVVDGGVTLGVTFAFDEETP